MRLFKSSEIAEKMGISQPKVRRWAREFLPSDPLASLRSGYTRKHNVDEAFRILLGGCLVSFTDFVKAKLILSEIEPWLLKRHFLPFEGGIKKRSDENDMPDKWVIKIYEINKIDFCYEAIGYWHVYNCNEISDDRFPGCSIYNQKIIREWFDNKNYNIYNFIGGTNFDLEISGIAAQFEACMGLYSEEEKRV
ncbi:MAG: hypothetical protein KKA60_12565, partial [Proteobacteria bacterium]|nr:hypothetical protein [Pseudomonadota bacterium]